MRKNVLILVFMLSMPVSLIAQYARVSEIQGWSGVGTSTRINAGNGRIEVKVSSTGEGSFTVALKPAIIKDTLYIPGMDTVGKQLYSDEITITDVRTNKTSPPHIRIRSVQMPSDVRVEASGADSTVVVGSHTAFITGEKFGDLSRMYVTIRAPGEMINCAIVGSRINPKHSAGIIVTCDK
jgi:hypothetical protein